MDKKSVGRPKEYDTTEERKVAAFRITDSQKKIIIDKFGSVQQWINKMLSIYGRKSE